MRRLGAIFVTAAAAFGCCTQAFALNSASATAGMSARVAESAGIQIVTPLILPSVTATTVAPNAAVGRGGSAATRGGRAIFGSNATLTVRGQAGDAVSMAVPESFTVVRNGGTEALTVRTTTNAQFGLEGDGVVLGGAVMGSNSMSVNVGGSLSLASADQLEPGAYEGVLVVVVQYN